MIPVRFELGAAEHLDVLSGLVAGGGPGIPVTGALVDHRHGVVEVELLTLACLARSTQISSSSADRSRIEPTSSTGP